MKDDSVTDLLSGDTSLQNIIKASLPDDELYAFNVDQYINDFRRQLIAEDVHCD